jgi:signal transduction histidine kinase
VNSPLLVGLFGAWAAVQVAIGAFFVQAYTARRRELEYLIFSLVCFGLAVTDAGLMLAYATRGLEHWTFAAALTHVGAIVATALNVHFVLEYVAPGWVRRVMPVVYGLAAVYSAVMAFGTWWQPGSLHVVELERFGVVFTQVVAQPTAVAASAYAVLIIEGLAAGVVLVWAYRGGKREVRGALIGQAVIVVCAGNDVLSVMGVVATPAALPYAFLIYGFGVADTLLVRYRRAAEELEATANELRQATEELTDSYLELSVVQEELFRKRQLASVGELAASIAHEVRNPLAVIVNAAASLKRQNLVAEDRNTLFGIIEEEITRLNNLVAELLRYARPMNVRREEIPLGDVLRAIGEGLDPKHTLDLHVDPSPEVQTVWADAALLRLALQNLVENACQSMATGGAVVITAIPNPAPDQPGVCIQVSDTGVGMDSRTLRRAMDPFFSTRPSGTGLGLPIAARILEAHGGRIEVHSRPGEGTTVTLYLPARRAEQRSYSESRRPEPRA